MKELYIKTINQWRNWLENNHLDSEGVWLVFYRKETAKPSLDYNSAVEEAICFGWIDSLVKKIDEQKYVRKFTPRKDNSVWSELNKKRVKKLIKEARMTKFGLAKVEVAKKKGYWNKQIKGIEISYDKPGDFTAALKQNKKAKNNFDGLPPSQQKRFYMWINIAKKKETRERRIKESIIHLVKNTELGLK